MSEAADGATAGSVGGTAVGSVDGPVGSVDGPVEALRRVGLFARLDEDALAALAAQAVSRAAPRGLVILREGEAGDDLVVLTAGSVAVVTTSAHGERVVVNVLHAPAHFGELALLDGAPRSATVEALENCDLLLLPRTAFLRQLAVRPALVLPLLTTLAAQLRQLTALTGDWVFLDLAGRLAKALTTLADATSPGDGEVLVAVTQGRLAEMAGGSRQRVNEALAGFEARGLLRRQGRALVLLDRRALRARAGKPQ